MYLANYFVNKLKMSYFLQVLENDGLSKYICTGCSTLLNEWDHFSEMCSRNNNIPLKQPSDGVDKVY